MNRQDKQRYDSQLNEFDSHFEQILCGLVDNLIVSVGESADQALTIASHFFDKDVSCLLTEFHNLYASNAELNDYKDDIHNEVDELLALAKRDDFDPDAHKAKEADTGVSENRIALAALQKEMEALVTQDEKIKARIVPVLQSMQYEDVITNEMHRLLGSWQSIFTFLHAEEGTDYEQEIQTLFEWISNEEEIRLFYNNVLRREYSHNDCQQDLSTAVDAGIFDNTELVKRFIDFSRSILHACTEHTKSAFVELVHIIKLTSRDAEDIQYLFNDRQETESAVKGLIEHCREFNKIELADQLGTILASKSSHSDTSEQYTSELMVALQSQDRIQQNMENLVKVIEAWWQCRCEQEVQPVDTATLVFAFGNTVLSSLTMESERQVVTAIIPGLETDSSDEEIELF